MKAMTAAELAAADALYRALLLQPCTCRWQWPYNVDRGKHLHQCTRCNALAGWVSVRCEPLPAIIRAAP